MTGETASYWCEQAWLGGPTAADGVLIGVADGRISSVEAGVDAPPADARRRAGLSLPGFANAHSHAFHRALRGRTHAGRGSFWTWRDQMYRLAAGLDPDRLHRLARATFAEMALAGYTSVGEFHYVQRGPDGTPYDDSNAMGDALVAAAAEAGVRLTLLDACYLHGGIGREREGPQLRFGDASVDAWIERVEQRRPADHVRLAAAVHSIRACTPDEVAVVAGWVAAAGVSLHAHVSEQPAENEAALAAYGRTPTRLLADADALGPRFTAVHATHLTDEDVALLGGSGSTCCVCSSTERDLADGIPRATDLRDAGARLSVGSDSQATIDAIEEARSLELGQRLVGHERGRFAPEDLLATLTTVGHASLDWPDAGHLSVGARADLVTVSLDSVRLAGAPAGDVLGAVVFGAQAPDVTDVTVDGVDVVEAGCHLRLAVAAELALAIGEAWT